MGNYKERLSKIIDGIRPLFETLSVFAFQGGGDIDELRKCFIQVYEGANKVLELYRTNKSDELPDELDIIEMDEFYQRLKADDFMPLPFDVPLYGDYTMRLNSLFMFLQRA